MKIILSKTIEGGQFGWKLQSNGADLASRVSEWHEDDVESKIGKRVKELLEEGKEIILENKYSNGEPIIAILGLEDTVDILDQSNLQDIFGRCLGEQTTFERIDGVFTELWDSRRVLTFDAVSKMMGA